MTVSSGTNRAIHRAQPPRGIYPARRNTRRSGCFPRREASSWLQATALKILTDSVFQQATAPSELSAATEPTRVYFLFGKRCL